MLKKAISYALCAGVSSLALSAQVAQAQDGGQPEQEEQSQDAEDRADFGTIVVTALRREQALQDTPLSVTAIGSEALQARGITALGDIANGTVPGMQFVPFAGNPTILAINARGIGTSDPTQGTQELAVPLYIDGVPLGRAQGLGLELINPERVEFLRGPQGQLFGRNAQGGAVQFVSQRPTGEFGFDASVEVATRGINAERLSFNLPEFANLRIQGSIVHRNQPGFTKNTPAAGFSSQADYGLLDSFGWRVAVEFNPTDSLRFNYSYDDSDIKDSQPYLVWVPVDIIGRTPRSPQPVFDGEYPDQVNSPTFNEFFETKSRGHALTIQLDASDAITLKSITSFREAGRDGSSTLGDGLVAGGSSTGILRPNANEIVDQEQFYQELQAFVDVGNFNLTVGATYFNEKVNDQRRSFLTGPGFNPPALGLSPAPLFQCIGLETCMTARSEQDAESDSYGIYAQGTYIPPILDEKLELTAGIRYTDDRKVAERTYIQPLALPPLTETTPSGPLPPLAVFEAKRWDPAFTVKYNFTPEINAYVRYATAYRAGGANVRSTTFTNYDEEEVSAWEVGFKSRLLQNSLILNVAYFHNEIDGFQANIQEQPTTNPSLTNTVNLPGTVTVQGLEVEASLRVADGLTLSAGYAYTDAEEFFEIDNPLTAAVDITRFYSIQTPEHAGNVAVDYESPDLGFGRFAFHADYALSSGYWTTPGGLQVVTLGPTYERPATKSRLLNARASIRDIPLGQVAAEVALFAQNLTNETFYTYAFDGAASGGGFAQFLQQPRILGVQLNLSY